ncbi:MAG: hypothetical protein S0880_08750 [Actinomycetota bacterium]|nr:hypothetical protein [Actinomycetota bacterium]
MTVIVIALVVAVAALGVLVVGLLRSHAEILRALHDLGVSLDPDAPEHDHADDRSSTGAASPAVHRVPDPTRRAGRAAGDIRGRTPDGGAASVSVGGGRRTLLAFLSTGCSTCSAFWEAFRSPDVDMPAGARLIIVTQGPEHESPGGVDALRPAATTVMSSAAWTDYGVEGSPYFVLVDDGTVAGEGTATSWDRVMELLGRAIVDEGPRSSRRDLLRGRPRPEGGDGLDLRDTDEALLRAGITPGDPRLWGADDPVDGDGRP